MRGNESFSGKPRETPKEWEALAALAIEASPEAQKLRRLAEDRGRLPMLDALLELLKPV
jgi:hypothetical protein